MGPEKTLGKRLLLAGRCDCLVSPQFALPGCLQMGG